MAGDPHERAPNEYRPGDTMNVRPIGDCTVVESYAIGNYHNNLGWRIVVKSPYGLTHLSYTINSLSTGDK